MNQINVVRGNIVELPLDLSIDCIVNAANSELRAGSGVCGDIFRAAGIAELSTACREVGPCAPGESRITPSFKLAERGINFIVHAVGPKYRSALRLAGEHGVTKIAFPLISSKAFGYPFDEAVTVALSAIQEAEVAPPSIVMVAFRDETFEALTAAVNASMN